VYLKDGLVDMYRGKALAAGHYSCQLSAEPKVSGCNALLPGFSMHKILYCRHSGKCIAQDTGRNACCAF